MVPPLSAVPAGHAAGQAAQNLASPACAQRLQLAAALSAVPGGLPTLAWLASLGMLCVCLSFAPKWLAETRSQLRQVGVSTAVQSIQLRQLLTGHCGRFGIRAPTRHLLHDPCMSQPSPLPTQAEVEYACALKKLFQAPDDKERLEHVLALQNARWCHRWVLPIYLVLAVVVLLQLSAVFCGGPLPAAVVFALHVVSAASGWVLGTLFNAMDDARISALAVLAAP